MLSVGDVIVVGGLTIFSAGLEKLLEEIGKEKHAKLLGLCTKCGLGIYAIKEINDVVKEVTKDFL